MTFIAWAQLKESIRNFVFVSSPAVLAVKLTSGTVSVALSLTTFLFPGESSHYPSKNKNILERFNRGKRQQVLSNV